MGNRVRDIRKARNMAGTVVAELLNITPQYYYEIERGKKRLSADMAGKLAAHFQVTTDYLLGLSDEPSPNASAMEAKRDASSLTPKEEKDIARDLERMLSDLESEEALAFHGETLDEESKELLRISLENSMRLAKQLAKQKFTPNKYRK
ncbi:helix-turn-helix domain-containing protein [Paenibacillus ehimensis]|uniref:Helix-turn-helix transcriptional regulator n=1 Tax=Paenibacillus ehimensis TaxID=79264 RepID=A0ABT8VCF3_9BACL|nr:helix-turn-helix transcriptional regulator [Paenibacillus ehimensis]MDO3678671.1 helix-turn-helix transcriptional regulator [Paenibacillus ehimensis]MEC0212614.1 helix-turn-helix transcriptional regulator [Paenibacillus ehimensis]